jgi:hypothetical protein
MSFPDLRREVVGRLEEANRGDRGWFLITRVHLSAACLKSIAAYLYDIAAADSVVLERAHYRQLAILAGVAGNNPGVTLRRHLLLAMETPLNLLRRTDGRSWRAVSLSPLGIALATENDANVVLERTLSRIVFCRQPYYTQSRELEYQDFDVRPYETSIRVMRNCDGWVDRDEFDLFLSRIRSRREVRWAVEGIREFRQITAPQRAALLSEVRTRMHSAKRYQNWRDMGLHTFSLFSLGVTAIRTDQILRLTSNLVARPPIQQRRPPRAARPGPRLATLRIPTPPPNEALSVPPSAREINAGTDAELLVAKLLEADGWRVVFYTNKRGFGFDLWAQKQQAVMLVEVKSSLGNMGPISITRLEYEAAGHHGANFYLAIVDRMDGVPQVRFVQDPRRLAIEEQHASVYILRREVWEAAISGHRA